MSYRLGVDVGGTFTDLVLVSPSGVARTCKVLSTTANYAEAIITGLRELTAQAGIPARDIGEIIHGTTVATNAILERRGARTGLLTTEGFRDLLEIGRLRLSRLYDLDFERPAPLVPRRWRREIRERMNHRGEVVTPLDREGAAAAIDRLLAEGVESIAVCFLHAYANPTHEAQVGAMIRERAPHVALTLSSEILPEMREFERTSTAVTNAYVMPVMGRYLASLEGELRKLEATRAAAHHAVQRRRHDGRGRAPAPRARHRVGARRRRHRHRRARPRDRRAQRAQHRHGRHDREGLDHRGVRDQAHRRVRDRRLDVAGQPAQQGRGLPAARARHRHRRGRRGRRQHRERRRRGGAPRRPAERRRRARARLL